MTSDTMIDDQQLTALGEAKIPLGRLADITARALKTSAVTIDDVRVVPVDYPTDTVGTAALDRVQGTASDADGVTREFSIFVKQVRSASLWPNLQFLPEPVIKQFIDALPVAARDRRLPVADPRAPSGDISGWRSCTS